MRKDIEKSLKGVKGLRQKGNGVRWGYEKPSHDAINEGGQKGEEEGCEE